MKSISQNKIKEIEESKRHARTFILHIKDNLKLKFSGIDIDKEN